MNSASTARSLSSPAARTFSSSTSANQLCAGDLIPVYRAYNNGAAKGIDSNHRITTNKASYDAQIAKGWAGEGVVICTPRS